ncbi:hypothetical protein DRQ32_01665 [bacterium]|nr:MAG: hypothetical protein DRQ32_01665 [bacterium]
MPDSPTHDEKPGDFLRLADGPQTTMKVKGSRFTGQVLRADSLEQAQQRLQTIRKQHHDATHHCWAALWGSPNSQQERFDDDGEPSGTAGRPILNRLRACGATDGLLVVIRWFGGTRLGTGGLAQAYSESAAQALEATARIQVERQIPLAINFGYDDLGAVEAILARRVDWTREVQRDFGDGPSFLVRVCRGRADGLRAELNESLGGRASIQAGAEILVES